MSKTPDALRGAALLIVVVLVTMLMVLIMAFFSLARLERRASTQYASTVNTDTLETSTLNLAIGQIRDASSKLEDDELWVSQPGMIRRYAGGKMPSKVYKLYSADVMTTASWKPGDDAAPTEWASEDGLWIDLNEPAANDADADEPPGDRIYPIVDPDATANGFRIEDAPATDEQKAPMPVKWLYVLRDGSLQAATGSNGTITVTGATPENPPVGRIAFWADDETCKLNINTASEPTPWDTPRMITKEDLAFGTYQPFQKEFQRYPGHPYTTALSPVFYPRIKKISPAMKDRIYRILPRVGIGGSEAGTRRMSDGRAVRLRNDRHFATVDEFLFDPSRERHPESLVSADMLRTGSFFLTAQSRAPEINLFGLPRISIWPVAAEARNRTIFDDLSVFCSTIGGDGYYLQRTTALDGKSDARISRNRKLWEYLLRLTSQRVPGYDGSLKDRWQEDHAQVGAYVFDYIRSTNLRDTTNRDFQFSGGNGQVAPILLPNGSEEVQGFGRYHTISEVGLHFICAGDGSERLYTQERNPHGSLRGGEVLVEAAMLMEPFAPAQGFFTLNQKLSYQVTGLSSLSIDGKRLFTSDRVTYTPNRSFGSSWHGRSWGGPQGVRTFIQDKGREFPFLSTLGRQALKLTGKTGRQPTMEFSGGEITISIFLNGAGGRDATQTIKVKFPSETFPVPRLVKTGTEKFRGCGSTSHRAWWSFASRYSFTTRCPHVPGPEYRERTRQWPPSSGPSGFKQGGVFRAEDVVRTLSPWHGDNRHVAGQRVVGPDLFKPNHFYSDSGHLLDHLFADTQGTQLLFGFGNEPGVSYRDGYGKFISLPSDEGTQLTEATYHFSRLPDVPIGSGKHNKWGDFDNGVAQITDGAYINKPDEGNFAGKAGYSYFAWNYSNPTEVIFSPNRLMPSPGMLGSLPTGVVRDQPWQTLLFRPQEGHPGAEDPPDHLLLDLFWMPVIEPYPISEPFSTAGKVNLNYQIVPFTWIKRATAMHGIFKSELPLALPNEHSTGYKLWDHETSDHPWMPTDNNLDPQSKQSWRTLEQTPNLARKPIDADETLSQFERRFEKGELFKAASEICEVHLVRDSESLSTYEDGSFWKKHLLTGDNSRERPYANIYGRVTTKSNVFRVHYRVQTIVVPGQDPSSFKGSAVKVRSEKRGAALVERFVDPNDPDLEGVDLAQARTEETVDDFYRFRILERREFLPR